jgi:polysaccharide pyruvyl transferase WcaK-like protein
VISRGFTGRRARSAAPRVGLFGLLGSGNIGNDASMESVLGYLSTEHPDAIVDAMCMGPEKLRGHYGIEAIPLLWVRKYEQRSSGRTLIALKVLGKVVDAFRTASWVRRHDVVIVPGMGVLEASLPLRASGVPYAMFLLSASGRLLGTKVALVSVGATVINQRLTRLLFCSAARLACYRSYRDIPSRDAMRQQGLDVAHDLVYPDLVFGIPAPPCDPGDPQTVGVGVMEFYGTNDDRGRAEEIHASYVGNMKCFIRWLVDNGRRIRLFVGDASDGSMVQEIMADLREHRPGLDPSRVVADPVSSFAELTRAMAPVSTVVATRYHNVICALRLGKPTISVGYADKNRTLMADMGLAEFCQSASSLDIDRLIEQFTELESRSAQLRRTISDRCAEHARHLDEQFAALSALLVPAGMPPHVVTEHKPAREGAR